MFPMKPVARICHDDPLHLRASTVLRMLACQKPWTIRCQLTGAVCLSKKLTAECVAAEEDALYDNTSFLHAAIEETQSNVCLEVLSSTVTRDPEALPE